MVADDQDGMVNNITSALDLSIPVNIILRGAVISAMSEIRHRYEKVEFQMPEMLVTERAMQSGIAMLLYIPRP